MNWIFVRGAGDIATGTLLRLFRCGYSVAALECSAPSAIRRTVSFSEAVYRGEATVEGVTARLVTELPEEKPDYIPLLIDPDCTLLRRLHPAALVDAILAKRNLGTTRDMAPVTIGLGPGFTAGVDVDYVIETMRGHTLGRVITEGTALPNTGTPGLIAGYGAERVIHAPGDGAVHILRDIGSVVKKGEVIASVGDTPVYATIDGLIRGMLPEGFPAHRGLKTADIDPRTGSDIHTVSDKALAVAGGVLEALLRSGVTP